MAASVCLARCEACGRCSHVSFSPCKRVCLWFAHCSIGSLHPTPGFRTLPANASGFWTSGSSPVAPVDWLAWAVVSGGKALLSSIEVDRLQSTWLHMFRRVVFFGDEPGLARATNTRIRVWPRRFYCSASSEWTGRSGSGDGRSGSDGGGSGSDGGGSGSVSSVGSGGSFDPWAGMDDLRLPRMRAHGRCVQVKFLYALTTLWEEHPDAGDYTLL